MGTEEGISFSGEECVLFGTLDKDSYETIKEVRKFKILKKGEFVFREGEYPKGVYCIHEGYLKAFKIGSDGKEQIIYLAKPGDLVGWQQITCDDPYSTSGVALEKVKISHIPREPFLEIVRKSPLSIALTKYICDDVILLESKVLELSQKSVRERLAANILLLNEKYGVSCDGHEMVGVPLTREDYANIIGTNTETVIKLLSEFRKEGIIDFVERRILILNMQALKKMSDFYR